jgi:pimeloyl-ACP methyl ester carboxylesterase
MHRLAWPLAALGLLLPPALLRAANLVTYRVVPHTTDSAITRFDEPHYVVFNPDQPSPATLLVFMSGTGGQPAAMSDLLIIAAEQGYRVVSLAYNDQPAVVGICPRDPNPACSAEVRQRRIFGDPVTRWIDDTPAESIVNRLTKLLTTLEREHPAEGWAQYLDGSAPRWDRIAVAGHSQGAGMAAYIAQRKRVARVILFSSPWDFFGRRQLAPWIHAGPGVTPSDAWFAAYHKKENTADLIAESYKALKVPPQHIRVFTLEPGRVVGPNPYHLSMVGNGATPRGTDGAPLYAEEWRFLLGTSR